MPTLNQKGDMGFTFGALAQVSISGGEFVKAMSNVAVSGDDPFNFVQVDVCDAAGDIPLCVGIAINDGSGADARLTVAQKGYYVVPAFANITVGQPIMTSTISDAVQNATHLGSTGYNIGKALSTAVSGNNVLISLNV